MLDVYKRQVEQPGRARRIELNRESAVRISGCTSQHCRSDFVSVLSGSVERHLAADDWTEAAPDLA